MVTVMVMVMVVVCNWSSCSTNSVSGLTLVKGFNFLWRFLFEPSLQTFGLVVTSVCGLFWGRGFMDQGFLTAQFYCYRHTNFYLELFLSMKFYGLHFVTH